MSATGPITRPAAFAQVAAPYRDAELPAAPVQPGEVWVAHRDESPLHAACPGSLRWVDRDDPVIWVAECDHCGETQSVLRSDVDVEHRRAERLRKSGLPTRFTDQPIPAHDGTRIARQHLQHLIEAWGTPDAPKPPMLIGPNGRGKTHLVARAGQQLIERHLVRVRFVYWADLLAEARAAIDARKADPQAETTERIFQRAATAELLVLDDLGAELQTDWALAQFERLVNSRFTSQLPVMGTTNVQLERWDEVFGMAAASRLHDLTIPIEVTGPDWRRA